MCYRYKQSVSWLLKTHSQKGSWTRPSLEVPADSSHSALKRISRSSQLYLSKRAQQLAPARMPWLLIHRAYQKSIMQEWHPMGSKGGNPHSCQDKVSCACWMLYLFCLQTASVIFPHMFPDITSTLEKCPWLDVKIINCRDCRSFRLLFAFFTLCILTFSLNTIPEVTLVSLNNRFSNSPARAACTAVSPNSSSVQSPHIEFHYVAETFCVSSPLSASKDQFPKSICFHPVFMVAHAVISPL